MPGRKRKLEEEPHRRVKKHQGAQQDAKSDIKEEPVIDPFEKTEPQIAFAKKWHLLGAANVFSEEIKQIKAVLTTELDKEHPFYNKTLPLRNVLEKLTDYKRSLDVDDVYLDRFMELDVPSCVEAIGSCVTDSCIIRDSSVTIDFAFAIPDQIFLPDSKKNVYRHDSPSPVGTFLHLRAVYLAFIHQRLSEWARVDSDGRWKVVVARLDDQPNKPILAVEFKRDDKRVNRVIFQLIPCISDRVASHFVSICPINCAKSDCIHHAHNLVRQDAAILSGNHHLVKALQHSNSIRKALLLIRIWMHQRRISEITGVSGFIASLLLVHCIQNKSVHSSWTASQVFKAFMRSMSLLKASSDSPILIGRHVMHSRLPTSQTGDDLFLVWEDRVTNFTSHVPLPAFRRFLKECEATIKVFDSSTQESIEDIVTSEVKSVSCRFDVLLEIPRTAGVANLYSKSVEEDMPSIKTFLMRAIPRLLGRGLTDRALSIVSFDCNQPDSSRNICGVPKGGEGFTIGITLNPVEAYRLVDHGPDPSEDPEGCKAYQRLWGKKSELRRFSTGIHECVVWSEAAAVSPAKAVIHNIHICEHLLLRHMGIKLEQRARCSVGGKYLAKTEDSFVDRNFHDFSEQLRKVFETADLPLALEGVSPACSALSHTSNHERTGFHGHSSSRGVPMDVVLRLESSPQWPINLAAMRNLATALFLRLQKLLKNSKSILAAEVVIGHDLRTLVSEGSHACVSKGIPECLVVTTRDRRTYRCHATFTGLTKAMLTDLIVQCGHSEDHNSLCRRVVALQAYVKTCLFAPLHTMFIKSMVQIHPMLSPAIRIIKQMLAEHMIPLKEASSPLFGFHEEFIETVAVAAFEMPTFYPYSPASPVTAVSRVLDFLRRFPFKTRPLDVPGAPSFDAIERWLPPLLCGAVAPKSKTERQELAQAHPSPQALVTIRSGFNPDGSWWDDPLPPWLRRRFPPVVDLLLKASRQPQIVLFNHMRTVLDSHADQPVANILENVILPNFDVEYMITTHKSRDYGSGRSREQKLTSIDSTTVDKVGSLMTNAFGHVAAIFFNANGTGHGRQRLGLVWKPEIDLATRTGSSVIVTSDAQVDRQAIQHSLERLGLELVVRG